jgi:hypothetical protein
MLLDAKSVTDYTRTGQELKDAVTKCYSQVK